LALIIVFFCRWKTLFMHPDTMEFQETMWVPISTVSTGRLCPNQRRVPQFGSLWASAVNALVLLVRLPVVVIVASPKLVDLLAGPCYLDSKSHGLLMNCGAEIFSLEEFFTAAYECNGHFWRILSILADKLDPGLPQTFLNGVAMTGENSGASAFMPGVIGSITKVANNDPMGAAMQMRDSFSANSRMGMIGIFFKAFMNPIAGAHWMYRMASRIVVQAIQASRAKRSIASVFWNVVSEGVHDYNTLVVIRMINTCGGLSIMAGYATPWGKVTYHYCVGGVRMTVNTFRLLTVFTVDMPLMACVCKDSVGHPAGWIISHCEAPDRSKAMLRRLADAESQCSTLVENMSSDLHSAFDETFSELYAGARYVGSSLDYLITVLNPDDAGQCDNYESSPYVSVIIPNPVDYFRVCAKTEVCAVRCQQQIEAFERVRPPTTRTTKGSQVVQSLFFPVINDDAYMPFPDTGIVALTELDDCTMCLVEGEDRCFIAGGFGGEGQFQVFQYCIPSALGQGVAKAGYWETAGISGKSEEVAFIRIATGGWKDIYSVIAMQGNIVQVCTVLTCVELSPSDVDTDVLGFEDMQVMDSVVVFRVRHVEGQRSYALSATVGQSGITWVWAQCSDTNIWDQDLYHIIFESSLNVILVPYDDVPLQICSSWDTFKITGCSQFAGFDRQYVPVKTRGKQARLSQYVAKGYGILLTADSDSHWLQMLHVDTAGSTAVGSLKNSMDATISYTVQKTCSVDSCIGCVNLNVQRLCYAAHQCLIARCIGTMVNQIRPMCAIGAVVESDHNTIIAALQGVWLIISDVLIGIIRISGGIHKPVSISWPDQVFYGLLCSAKDVIASQVSVFTSAINGVVQFSMPIAQVQMSQAVDNKFLATFSMTMTAITGFIFQLCLWPLYAAAAVQKSIVCETSSLIGTVVGNNQVTIGDPEIQRGSTVGAGSCLTQAFSESSQSGGSDEAFVSASSSLATQLGGVAISVPLDQLKHGLDATFAWVLGIITSLQDVISTADAKK
jgi:hypothetical protein